MHHPLRGEHESEPRKQVKLTGSTAAPIITWVNSIYALLTLLLIFALLVHVAVCTWRSMDLVKLVNDLAFHASHYHIATLGHGQCSVDEADMQALCV